MANSDYSFATGYEAAVKKRKFPSKVFCFDLAVGFRSKLDVRKIAGQEGGLPPLLFQRTAAQEEEVSLDW